MKKINKYTLSKYNFWFLLLVLMLSQPVIAQTSLPACTASIADTDGDSITDDDGVSGRIDIDKDGDGLIEICDLDGINEIRYQADGSGYKANENATKITQGCPVWGCIGYELVGSLNFNSATDYRNGSINTDWTVADYASDTDVGWQPLPHFEAVFNGNGFIIRNLQINRVGENNVGLFAVLHQSGRIENIELVYPNVRGGSNVGGLVGNNNGVVINSYVRDYDTDASTRDTTKYIEAISGSVGGLVGRNNGGSANIGHIINSGAVINVQIKENTSTAGIGANVGGLTGFNLNGAEIRNSYARGAVKGPCGVGGLTANNFSTDNTDPTRNSKIINSYATGNVTTGFGKCNVEGNIRSGGLAAVNSGLIANSYTTSCFSSGTATVASTRRGGVVQNNDGTISNSYYQTTGCSDLRQTPSGSNKTQTELQTPIYNNGIYRTWLPVEWDFGDNSQYPVIRYTGGHDKDNPGCGYTSLPDCDTLIKNQLPVGLTATSVAAIAPAADMALLKEFNSELSIFVEDDQHPDARGPPLVFPTSIVIDVFSDRQNPHTIHVDLGSTKQTYKFNVIPVLSIPAAPTPPLQPSAGESITTWTGVSIRINNMDRETKVVPTFSKNAFNYDIYVQSGYADGGDIFPDISSNLILQPSPFNVANKLYKLYDTSSGDKTLELNHNYQVTDCINITCDNNGESLTISDGFHITATFNIRDTSTDPATSYGPFSIEYIPVESSKYVVVNSEVNDEAATFTADRALHVEVGDKVSVKVADSLVERDGINRPLYYYWYSSSGPTLFSGTQYGTSVSFDIDDTMFRNTQSAGDAVLTLTMHDKYDMTAAAITEEIPVRIFGRLSLTSEDGEVLRDQVASTLHRVVLAADQPQAVISAISLNKSATLTVDDSAAKVTAVDASDTFNSSIITVQVDEGDMIEFTITVTSGDADIIHIVRVFRRSGEVSLQDIEIADITFDEAITTPSSYIGLLSAATTSVTINQLILTISDTNASAISAITVDEDGSGGNSPVAVITPSGDFYEPGVEATIATDSFNLMAGSVVNITIRMRDAYVAETQSSETLADLSYTEGVYTIEIENALPLDNDDNGNGLIDIYTLDDLDEMRNQYTDMPNTCGSNSDIACEGFELRRSLDFNAANSYQDNTINTEWTTGKGWSPILASDFSPFDRVFEGNGFTISGLYIDKYFVAGQGLFFHLDDEGVIKNVGLLDVSIRANSDVGSLVGENNGTIINSYVTTATIVGSQRIGGLIGWNRGTIINSYVTTATIVGNLQIGGLAGYNSGDIISSFAYADVIGFQRIGGLVGRNNGDIINTYVAGTVASTQTVTIAGGLVGWNNSAGVIKNSYAISQVMPLTDGDSRVDGLVGSNQGSITASYWDKTVNADLETSSNAKTTAELQNPTAPGATPADTYYGWRTTAWDFGDRSHYPTLYYATTDNTVSACADNPTPSSALPRCGSRLPNQAVRNLIPDLPDLEVSEITINAQPAANSDGTINEGSNVRLMVNAIGESESYRYAWSQISGNTLVLTTTDTATLNVAIPLDFVELDATTAAITFQVEVNDGSLTISRRAIITINQIDNGNPVTEVDVNAARLRVITTTADADGTDSFRYQWQQLVFGGAWTNIPAATTAAYWLPADVNARIQYRVEVTHTDSQGHTISYQQGPFRARFDDDNDGLIDIYTLEDLDAIRHQYSNMPNYCGSSGDIACNGFELRRSLDFNAAESYQSGMIDPDWTTSTGWLPIGLGNPTDFDSLFEGNGYTISGLHINRSGNGMALFNELNATGQINNIGLLDVAVRGGRDVGSLVGYNNGSIINSYATGEVSGSHRNIGGLVGINEYTGSIRSSFAKVRVSGWFDVGGLVGFHVGRITNSYAAGTVEVTLVGNATVGGLVGEVGRNDGEIINSYAIGRVISNDNNAFAGGLVGDTTGTVIVSYWNTQTSGLQSSAGAATSRTTAQLQSPTAAGLTPMDTYYGWDDKVWDFGSNQDYPALRYVAGGLNACNADMSTASDLPQCGSLLANQERIGQVALAVSEVTVSSQPMANVDGTINEGSNVSLMVSTTGGSESYSYAWSQTSGNALELGSSDGATLDITIPSDFIAEDAITTVLTFTVIVDDGMSTISRSKMITITKASLTISGVMLSAATIAEGSTATVTFDVSGGTGIYQYAYKLIAGADEIALPSLTPPAILKIPADIIAAADSDRVVELNITVSDDDGRRVGHNEELTIQKIDNGLAKIELSRVTSRTLTVKVGSDPDGDATTPNYAYQWQWRATEDTTIATAQWINIDGATDASYTISDDLVVDDNEFRVQVTYTDGQGYQETSSSNEIRYIPPSELPSLIVSNIELSAQPPANADDTINEGSKATLTFNVSGGTGVYQYEAKIDDATYTSFELPFMYNIADDLVAADTTTQTVRLTIRISDQIDEIKDFEHIEELHILKTNKGSADININITSATLTVIIGTDPDGDPNPTSYIYQWQSKTGSEWMDIDDADDASYTISGDLASAGGEFRVQITYTDGQGYPETPTSNAIRYTPPDSSGLRIRTKVFLEGPLR